MTQPRPAISLILPAFNEARTIARTVQEAVAYFRGRGLVYEIVVAADGNDGTRDICRDLAITDPAIKVIGENARRGKGRGIREAVAIATGEIIGFADADNKVPIEEYGKVDRHLAEYPIVIGSRAMVSTLIEKKQPLYRQIGSVGFGFFMRAVIGLPGIRDTQCGFKFFRGPAARDLFALQRVDGYMFDVEILYIASKRGYAIKQVPVRWRDDADSRLELVVGNLRNVRDIFRIRMSTGHIEPAPAPLGEAQAEFRTVK
jgi:dolichyl-phosphate beta-glucosyltransferase